MTEPLPLRTLHPESCGPAEEYCDHGHPDNARTMLNRSRRHFLTGAGKALGGLALVHAVPNWAFAARQPASDLVHRSSWAMGTPIRLSLLESEFTAAASDGAFHRLQEVDRLLTVHNDASALMHVNNAPGEWVSGADLAAVCRAALRFGSLSEGAMDVTVLPALRKYGFVPGVASASDTIDYSRLEVSGSRTRVTQDGTGADFGGIAKGYGVDQAVATVRQAGASAALIDAGGDLYALGRPDTERPWKIGIRHPERDTDLVATLEVEDEAVATSGTYMQKRIVDGKEVSHLIDPRTGTPVHHVVSATIVARDTMTADALATAASVLDRQAGQHLIESLTGVEGFLIYEDGTSFTSSGLARRLKRL